MTGRLAAHTALSLRELEVTYSRQRRAVRGISLEVAAGRCLAVVGESGSGKSSVAHAVLGLLPRTARVRGQITVAGHELTGASRATLRAVRGRVAGFVSQDPMQAFDPLLSVRASVAEAWQVHRCRPGRGTIEAALERLGIASPAAAARMRPYQWSGGMLQRAAIAAAGAHQPALIIADEPTSALDADRADSVLEALRSTGAGILLISHDLALVGRHSDDVAVMYAGRIVEQGPADGILAAPRHPYTAALLAASPRPGMGLPVPLPGAPPALDEPLCGCPFASRCPLAGDHCRQEEPPLAGGCACWEVKGADDQH